MPDMIKPITQFMRNNVSKCVQGAQGAIYCGDGRMYNVLAKERVFLDKDSNVVAHSTTFIIDQLGHRLIKTVLKTAEGLFKVTEQKQEIIKLSQKKGKKLTKYPYQMNSSVFYNENKPVKRKMFFISQGVKFEKSDESGLLVYKRTKNFKTHKLTVHTPLTRADLMFDARIL